MGKFGNPPDLDSGDFQFKSEYPDSDLRKRSRGRQSTVPGEREKVLRKLM